MQLPPTVLSEDVHGSRSKKKENPSSKTRDKANAAGKASSATRESDGQKGTTPLTETEDGSSGFLVLKPPSSLTATLFSRLERLHGKEIKRLLQIQYRYFFSTSRH